MWSVRQICIQFHCFVMKGDGPGGLGRTWDLEGGGPPPPQIFRKVGLRGQSPNVSCFFFWGGGGGSPCYSSYSSQTNLDNKFSWVSCISLRFAINSATDVEFKNQWKIHKMADRVLRLPLWTLRLPDDGLLRVVGM